MQRLIGTCMLVGGLAGCGSAGGSSLLGDSGAGGASDPGGGGSSVGASNTGVAGRINLGNTGGASTAGAAGGSDGNCTPMVIGLLRDFRSDHPNFEWTLGTEEGIVDGQLGADRKPVFAGDGLSTVTNAADFNEWYNDTPGVNESFQHTLHFTESAQGTAVYDDDAFFPLDGRGFGNQGNSHNYHFTFELHMEFLYNGGEVFTFRGDDDVFVFINGMLVIDLGGVHTALEGSVDLDAEAARLGIEPGNVYAIDMFHAERHTSESNFRVETNMTFVNCDPIIVP